MTLEYGQQIIKTRDDHAPVFMERNATELAPNKAYRLESDADCSWAKADEHFGPDKLRPRIEPWLTALVQSDHLSVLIGSGLTRARLTHGRRRLGAQNAGHHFRSPE